MIHLRFIGTECVYGTLPRFTEFGQAVALMPHQASELIIGGGAFLPAAEFDALFTASEAEGLKYPAMREAADDATKANLRAAYARVQEIREALEGGATIEEVL